jgi:transcriptional regulator with XRE-family HTH domain
MARAGGPRVSLTGAQVRAARGLLNWSVKELSERTGLAVNTVRRIEAVNGAPAVTAANLDLVRTTLEQAGVTFIEPDGMGPGVRLSASEPLPKQRRRRDGDAA